MTLVPAMAGTAGHVTMLQRSPTYVCRCRRRTPSPTLRRKLLGADRGYALTRRKNIAAAARVYAVLPALPAGRARG